MFSVDLLNMSAEMETGSTSTNGVYEVTMALKNDFAIKIKEIEHVFTQLADVTKSHDQTKQELRRTLCKTCRDNLYVLQKIPLKTYSDFGGQTEHQLLQSGSINDGKQHEPGKDDSPYQKKKQITPTEHVAKLELVVKELQDNYQKERKNVENLQASLETVQKEKDSYKRQMDNQQVEIVRLRQKTECVPESQHPAKTQSSEVASQEDKFNELVQDIGKGGDTAQNLVPGHQEHDQKIINSLRNENEGKSNKMGDYNKKCPGSTEDEEINRLKKENSTLQEDRSTRDVLIKSLRDEKDKQIGKNKQLMEEKQKLEQTVHELQTQLTDVNSKVNRKQGENQSLYDNQSTYKCNYNLRSRKEQEDKQTQHLEQMSQDKRLFEQNLDQHNEIVANLKADLENKMKEIETLAKDKSVLTKENEEIRVKMNGAHQEKKQIQLNLQQLEVTLSQTKSKLEEKEKKNQKLIETLTDRDAELESLSTEKSNFHSQMELAKKEKAQIQRELDDQQEQRQKETSNIRDTENEIRKLTRTCDEQKRKLQCAEQEKKQLESQSAAIVQKRDLIQHELDEVKQNLETTTSTIRGMQIENQRLTDILGTSNERLSTLQDNHQKLKNKMTTLQQEYDANKKALDHETLALKEMENENALLKTELGKCEERLSTLQDNYNKLETKMKTLQEKHDQTKQTLEERTLANRKTEEEIASLKSELASRDEELRSTKTERDTLNSQLTDAQHEKLNIQRDLKEQREKSAQTEKQLLKAKKDIEGCLTTRDEELRSTKSERDKLNSQLKNAQHEKLNIQRDLDEQREKLAQTEKQLLKAKQDIQNRTESLRINEERLQTLHDNHHKLKGAMATLQLEHDRTKQALDGTTLSNRKMEEENAQLKAERDKQREEIQQCNQQIEELKKPRKKRIVLGLRSERSGLGKSLVDMVTREMTTRLQKRLDVYNLNLVVSFSQISSEVTNGFQIALCLNMSRVGTNIVDSIKGMKVDRDLFVMVLHHTNKENLSSLTPTSHRVTGSEVRQLGGILDMAFSSDSGLYDCDLNNAAMEKIAVILKKCLIL